MRVLLDTSVVVAALVEDHLRHRVAFPWLRDLRNGDSEGLIAAHSIAEIYAVLSSLPISPRITPSAAWALIEHSVLPLVQVIELSAVNVQEVVRRLSRQGLSGGVVYDALIAEAAIKADAELIVTLNAVDFRRVTRGELPEIREP